MSENRSVPLPTMANLYIGLGLTLRAVEALSASGIDDAAKLCALSRQELSGVRGIGRVLTAEIATKLSRRGLSLRDPSRSPAPIAPRSPLPAPAPLRSAVVAARVRAIRRAFNGAELTRAELAEIVVAGSGIEEHTAVQATNLTEAALGWCLRRSVRTRETVADLHRYMVDEVLPSRVGHLSKEERQALTDIQIKLASWGFGGVLPNDVEVEIPSSPTHEMLLELSDEWTPSRAKVLADWCETHELAGAAAMLRGGSSTTQQILPSLGMLMGFDVPYVTEGWSSRKDAARSACTCECERCASDDREVRVHCDNAERPNEEKRCLSVRELLRPRSGDSALHHNSLYGKTESRGIGSYGPAVMMKQLRRLFPRTVSLFDEGRRDAKPTKKGRG